MDAKLLQLCLTLHHSMDCSLLGSSVHVILQAILDWVKVKSLSRVRLFVTLWAAASQALEWVAISFSRGSS